MKLLHTADWHLNDRLGRKDRTEHLRPHVERVAEICNDEGVDVLVIAGDLFSEQAQVSWERNEIAESFEHLRQTFGPFFAKGGIVLAVTGNHDQAGRVRRYLDLARAGMSVVEPIPVRGGYFQRGKMYLLDRSFVGRVRDGREGFDVQFVLLPFPSLSRLLSGAETGTTAAELNRPVAERVAEWIRNLSSSSGYDPDLRTVLVAHLNVSGADVGRGMFRISEDADVVLDAVALPTGFDYVALGHIHKPQCIRGLDHVRYSGSLDRMDHGDDDPMKEVVLVEIGLEGRRRVTPFPITPTTLVTATITDVAAAAEQIAAQVAHPETSLVRVVVAPAAAEAGGVDAAIHELLPNVSSVEWQAVAVDDDSALRGVAAEGSVRQRVLDYLARRLADDPAEADLKALASEYLEREGCR
jgi:exonuclease SbcD